LLGVPSRLDICQYARDNPDMETVSKRLKSAIENSGKSRRQISLDTGIDEASLCRFASGKRGLSMEAIDQLALYFGLALVKKGRQ
jgi:transcriptional regulator with XRE-family HTH domain